MALKPYFFKTINIICDFWNTEPGLKEKTGFTVHATRRSISRASHFAEDILKENGSLPPTPGPFKVTAAFLASSLFFVEFRYYTTEAQPRLIEMSCEEQSQWKARFLFKAITVFLLQQKLASTQKMLAKEWDVPSRHYRLDFLNFMRWCEIPFTVINPPPPNKPEVDFHRVNRLIMAFSLMIEACYYQCGNKLNCDVRNNVHVKPDLEDLSFDEPIEVNGKEAAPEQQQKVTTS